jgi:hypothetical protein
VRNSILRKISRKHIRKFYLLKKINKRAAALGRLGPDAPHTNDAQATLPLHVYGEYQGNSMISVTSESWARLLLTTHSPRLELPTMLSWLPHTHPYQHDLGLMHFLIPSQPAFDISHRNATGSHLLHPPGALAASLAALAPLQSGFANVR